MDINQLMKQAQEMQKKMIKMQEDLATQEFEGRSGGGLVVVKINGKGEALSIKIDASLIVPDDKEIIEDLIVASFNDAKAKLDSNSKDSMGGLFSGAGLKFPF